MGFDVTTIGQLFDLGQHGPDTFVGVGPAYPWGRVYGGQVIAQGLWAAMQTVDDRFVAHSVHAYFIRGGDYAEPIRYEVDRIRNGRSFVTRLVVARQSGGAILNLAASFQVVESTQLDDPRRRRQPGIPDPDDCPVDDWSPNNGLLERRRVPSGTIPGRAMTWSRVPGPIEDPGQPTADADRHRAALAFASDDWPMGAVFDSYPDQADREANRDKFITASLDHAVWFLRPVRADEWMLFDFASRGFVGGRGLALGDVYDRSGHHVATVSQEVLVRDIRRAPRRDRT